jgi:hypothetical protein
MRRDPASEPTKHAIDELAVAVAELSMNITRLERRLANRPRSDRPPGPPATRERG